MEAYKQIIEINNNNQLNISLPDSFNSKYVEVIILPFNKDELIQHKKELQKETWDDLPKDLKKDILKSIKEADNGELIPHELAMKRIKEKVKKNQTVDEFLEKWTGFAKGIDPDKEKFNYLLEKYK